MRSLGAQHFFIVDGFSKREKKTQLRILALLFLFLFFLGETASSATMGDVDGAKQPPAVQKLQPIASSGVTPLVNSLPLHRHSFAASSLLCFLISAFEKKTHVSTWGRERGGAAELGEGWLGEREGERRERGGLLRCQLSLRHVGRMR